MTIHLLLNDIVIFSFWLILSDNSWAKYASRYSNKISHSKFFRTDSNFIRARNINWYWVDTKMDKIKVMLMYFYHLNSIGNDSQKTGANSTYPKYGNKKEAYRFSLSLNFLRNC